MLRLTTFTILTVLLFALVSLIPHRPGSEHPGTVVEAAPLVDALSAKEYASFGTVNKVPVNSRDYVWEYLSKHFTREQTAGIMGNLRQEHNFNTSDVSGGLGIAQWIGGRRTRLMAKPNYDTLKVQLDFLMEELNTNESTAGNAIRGSVTVEQATVAFESRFERCGDCRTSTRLQYAYEILGSY